MGYYIKCTGRGYLKNVDVKYAHGVDCQSKFSKQKTLAYCADSATEAEIFKQDILKKLKKELAPKEEVYEVAKKIVAFPENFKNEDEVIDFIDRHHIKDSKERRHLKNYFESDNYTFQKYDFKYVMQEFCDLNTWRGFGRIKDEYKSIKNAINIISKGKVIQDENNEITFTKVGRKNFKWNEAQTKDNKGWSNQLKGCSRCGAKIPGAKYVQIEYSIRICPFCVAKLAEESIKNIEKLGEPIKKAYTKAMFMEKL